MRERWGAGRSCGCAATPAHSKPVGGGWAHPSPTALASPPPGAPLLQATLVQQWTAMDVGRKQQIKQALLHTLGAQVLLLPA